MDKDILKLLPQKAFKLISIKDSIRIGAIVTKSIIDKKSYDLQFQEKTNAWKWKDINLIQNISPSNEKLSSKEDGEKILKIYFSQFFEKNLAVHLDLRAGHFSPSPSFSWAPSKLHYHFSNNFIEGIRLLYTGFYKSDEDVFIKGLASLGMIKTSMTEDQKTEIKKLFYNHFGEGKSEPVLFSLSKLHDSFNAIFSFFLKEDIPLNPEFAVLGINLVTLYLTLEKIPFPLNVSAVFLEVEKAYE